MVGNMTDITSGIGTEKSTKVSQAMVRHKRLSRAGLSERLFGLLFSGLVYPQIWEDPAVDMEAMDIQPHHRMVTIGSGGCNMLAYLSKKPARIDVVDLKSPSCRAEPLQAGLFPVSPLL